MKREKREREKKKSCQNNNKKKQGGYVIMIYLYIVSKEALRNWLHVNKQISLA